MTNVLTLTTPLLRQTVGFDRFNDLFESLLRDTSESFDNYPPYNIEKTGAEGYRITMAVADSARSEERNVGTHFNIDLVPSEASDRLKYNSFSASVRSSELTHHHHVRPLP